MLCIAYSNVSASAVVERKTLGLDCCRLKDSFVIPKAFCGLLPRKEDGTKAEVAAEEARTNRAVVETFMMKRAGY
jgi:hypothetical protein